MDDIFYAHTVRVKRPWCNENFVRLVLSTSEFAHDCRILDAANQLVGPRLPSHSRCEHELHRYEISKLLAGKCSA